MKKTEKTEKNALNVVELFSGIGSQAKSLANIGVPYKIVGTSEWDIHAMCAYDLIHHGPELHDEAKEMSKEQLIEKLKPYNLSLDCKSKMKESTKSSLNIEALRRIYSAILKNINYGDISCLKGESLPINIDIMTYSFPCQDISNVGSFHGYNKGIDRNSNSRSSLLWEVERILKERKDLNIPLPRYLVLENVKSLFAPRHRKHFDEWKKALNHMGYFNKVYILKAENLGAPQSRHRLIMISVFVNNCKDKEKYLEEYFEDISNDLENREIHKRSKKQRLEYFLRLDYKNNDRYLQEALECQPNDTKSRRKIWEDNPKLVDESGNILPLVPTLTTKQDRHPNAGNIYFDENNGKSKFRYLTPRECFLLMGFTEADFDSIINNNFISRKSGKFFRRDKLITLAGNSVHVLVLENVFKQIIDIDKNLRQIYCKKF